ncbi:MAG: formyltransferase family protein [Candidatus Gastranaerophilales bacterium]|nr:formyltransferase family protein [Candidatus Gastranaerophilales bacterium]
MVKIALLASGRGSNAEAIIKHFENHTNVEIQVFSDIADAPVLALAGGLSIKAEYLPFDETYSYFSQNRFDLYVLAGYMRILPDEVLDLGTFVNIHPSLLPAFKGKDAIKQAYDYGVKVTGVSVHYVTKDLDGGPIIAQVPVNIQQWMNFAELEEEIHNTEHTLYPMVIESLLYDKIVDFAPGKPKCSTDGCGGCGGSCAH